MAHTADTSRPGRARRAETGVVEAVFEAASDAAGTARSFLASERGRRLRGRVATVLIVGAPLIAELPVIRRSPLARIVRTAGVVTLLVKGAEWLRDWEPQVQSALDAG